ncbi:MAG: hypothetical protein A2X94_00470 [Bdellovibrionales bacterium GWB1_55_8]|nr:MAG: hypothetical protein A2X94_00470 [Bdellovibrionales bacterium GWB1_55_8]
MSNSPRLKGLNEIKALEDRVERFRQMSLLYSQMVHEEGILVRPFRSPGLELFANSSPERQLAAIDCLSESLEIFTELRDEGCSLKDTPRLLWRSLNRLRLIPEKDIFDKISDEDVVEIYSLDHRQRFRNLKFFEVCSFSIEDIFAVEWWNVTRRDPEIERKLYDIGQGFVTGKTDKTIEIGIPEHVFEEVNSTELLKCKIQLKYMSPLRTDGRLSAVMVTNRSTIVGSSKHI